MSDRAWALGVFGLRPDATEQQIRQAHRDLAAVWHPDRFGENERLRRRAELELKKINAAKDALPGSSGDARSDFEQQAPAQYETSEASSPPASSSNGPVKDLSSARSQLAIGA